MGGAFREVVWLANTVAKATDIKETSNGAEAISIGKKATDIEATRTSVKAAGPETGEAPKNTKETPVKENLDNEMGLGAAKRDRLGRDEGGCIAASCPLETEKTTANLRPTRLCSCRCLGIGYCISSGVEKSSGVEDSRGCHLTIPCLKWPG